MGLSPGTRLGAYEIVSPIGAGGMGEVYRARDTRLARDVAVKVLPEDFLEGEEPKARFEREAKLLAALNHPNIAAIHSFEEISGRHILVMELLEGTTLRDRLDSGSIPPREAVDYALQIARGLSAGHEKGIVHRDLKPENLFVSKGGHLKILDFGLAKRIEREETGDETGAPTESKHTEPGTVMGTVAYMSPEQVRGLPVDHRSDIFSFGTILYELLSGKKAFKKDTASDTMAAIMRDEPPELSESGRNIPPALDRVVKHCLEKDRENRFQSTKDIAFALSEASAPASPGRLPASEAPAARIPLAWIAAGVVGLGLVGFLVLRAPRSRPAAAPLLSSAKLTQITDSLGLDAFPSFSPDGAQLAYCSDRGGGFEIFVRQLAAGGREIQITAEGQDNLQPAWSPDGREIAYASRDRPGIWLVPALGGTPRRLTDFGSRPAWSPDGTTIAFQSTLTTDLAATAPAAAPPSSLFLVPAAGGTPVPLTRPGSPEGGHGAPAFTRDGKTVLFGTWALHHAEIWSVARVDGSLQRVMPRDRNQARGSFYYDPVTSPRGDWVYFAATSGTWLNASLWRIRVQPASGGPWGEPEQVTSPGSSSMRQFAISPRDGATLAYAALSTASNIWSLPTDARSAAAAGPAVLLTRAAGCRNATPAFSPDGTHIAFVSCRAGGNTDVWLMDPDGQNARQLTDNAARVSDPAWFPDGERIAFLSPRGGTMALWSVTLPDRSEKRLIAVDVEVSSSRLSPDGRLLTFTSRTPAGLLSVWVAPLDGGVPRQVTFDREGAGYACWSPDGRFLALEVLRGPDMHAAIVPVAGGEPTVVTRERGLSWPHGWSPDGEKILFAGQREGLWNLYWISRRGGPEHRLTNYSSRNSYVRYPAWSPRGDQIVYEYAETTGNIWLMDLPR